VGESNGGMEKIAQIRASCRVILTKYYPGDQIKKNEMGGSYETYGKRRDACRVLVRKLRVRAHLKDVGVDCRISLKWKLKK